MGTLRSGLYWFIIRLSWYLSSRLAKEFARNHYWHPEPRMNDSTWIDRVGCRKCDEDGIDALCWGIPQCHGISNGCGCVECWEERLEIQPESTFWKG